MDKLKQFYMTVYSVAYSQCGNYLAAGNSYGNLAIFNLSALFEYENENVQQQEEHKHPVFTFSAHRSPIYSLVSTKKLIISGSVGEIGIWKWNDVKKKEAKPTATLILPQGDNLTKPEVNSIAVSKDDGSSIYAGCGDNKIYCFDAETGKIKFELVGHTDYIHCVALGSGSVDCVSGSEDGSVRIWDARKGGKEVHIVEPYKHELSSRPQFGKWIGCVALDENDDWLVCGGAPALSIWHLHSLLPAVCLSKPDATLNVVHFHEDTVISGGSEPCVNHWTFNGELVAEVPTSSSSVFDIAISCNSSRQCMCSSGSSNQIDICTDFRFKDFSLFFD